MHIGALDQSENIFATMGPDTLDPHPKLLVIADFDTAKRIGLAERPTSTIGTARVRSLLLELDSALSTGLASDPSIARVGTAGFMAPEVYMAKEVKKSYSFAADSTFLCCRMWDLPNTYDNRDDDDDDDVIQSIHSEWFSTN